MKRSEKNLPSKAKFNSFFFNLIAGHCVEHLGVSKIVQDVKFEDLWDEVEAKKVFPDTTIHKYVRLI